MTQPLKTVEVQWDRIDRDQPVTVTVKDDRTAVVEYKRATFQSTVDAGDDVTGPVRERIAGFAVNAGRPALAVVIYDVREDPEHYLMVCTDDGDLVPDDRAPEDYQAAMLAGFKKWLADNKVKPRRRRPAPTATVATLLDDPEPDTEPETDPETVTASTPEPEQDTNPTPDQDWEDTPLPGLRSTRFTTPERTHDADLAATPTRRRTRTDTDSPFRSTGVMTEGKNDPKATTGWQGTVNALLGTNLPPSPAEARRREFITSIAQAWPGAKRVAVINDKGGSGKSPGAILLAATLAKFGTREVAVFDNNENAGMAKDRVEVLGGHDLTAKDLATDAAARPDMPATTVSNYMFHHADDRYHLLAAHHPAIVGGEVDPPLDREEVGVIYRALATAYPLVITDSGNSWTAENWGAMLARADQLVVPMVTSTDRFYRAEATLENVYNLGGAYEALATNAVVVVSTWKPGDRRVAAEFAARWEGRVRAVVVIPYDRHIDSHNLRFGDLRPATQDAFLELGARVVEGLRDE